MNSKPMIIDKMIDLKRGFVKSEGISLLELWWIKDFIEDNLAYSRSPELCHKVETALAKLDPKNEYAIKLKEEIASGKSTELQREQRSIIQGCRFYTGDGSYNRKTGGGKPMADYPDDIY